MPASAPLRERNALLRAYDKAAEGWHEGISKLGYPGAYRALLTTHPPAPATRVLDAGTGSGAFAAAFLDVAGPPAHLTLLDPSRPMLEEAGTRLRTQGTTPELIETGIGTDLAARFDVVLCAHVIEHLPDPAAALTWLLGRLAPGGRLYLAASRPHWCTAILRWKWGHRAFRPEEMLEMFRTVGASATPFAFPAGPPSRTSMGYVARRTVPDALP